jgi:perosamine synthetase
LREGVWGGCSAPSPESKEIVCGYTKKMIPIYKPFLSKYKHSAISAIESEWISNYGMYVDLAADALKKHLNAPHCILMNNGTSATHALFKALKFKYPEINKIYLPNHVFIAPYNCALMEYDASQLEIMKINPETMNIDTSESYIRSLEPNSAVVIVHNLGSIVNVPRLKRLRPDIIFVEDNCEGLFGKYEGMFTGTFEGTLCSAVSFYGNKTITTGEGGAFFTHDLELYKYLKCFYSHGMSEKRYVHNMIGTNYRMTNIQAAFLYDQINDIDTVLGMKRKIFDRYKAGLESHERVQLLATEKETESSNWMFVLFIKDLIYEKLEKHLLEKNIQIRPLFYDVREHKYLEGLLMHDGSFLKKIEHGFMLPSFPELTSVQQDYIMACIKEYIDIN